MEVGREVGLEDLNPEKYRARRLEPYGGMKKRWCASLNAVMLQKRTKRR